MSGKCQKGWCAKEEVSSSLLGKLAPPFLCYKHIPIVIRDLNELGILLKPETDQSDCLINFMTTIVLIQVDSWPCCLQTILFHGHIGLPSSPSLTVVARNLQQIIFTISPPSYAGQCVLNYTITATSSDGSVVPDITVEVSDNITFSEDGFDLCNNVYNFTVVANTLAGPGQRSAVVSAVVSPGVTHFLGKFHP